MSSQNAGLYGQPRPKKPAKSAISSSSLTFSSALSSLISKDSASSSSSKYTTGGRSRSSKSTSSKDDIFSTHNRNAKKRAAADMLASGKPSYATSDYHASLDADQWKRSKRKMEEKARLYAAMKRGDVEDGDERYAVDFDRKWAEAHPEGAGAGEDSEQDEDGSDEEGEEESLELVEYVDALGRQRKGTRAEAAREERRKRIGREDAENGNGARPAMPNGLIYGDAVQHSAFDPEQGVQAQMAELAAKRDREPTPPEETHFDSRAEIRNKGTGFFAFSRDEDERRAQMEGLRVERTETERARAEKEDKLKERRDARRREVEERRKEIRSKRDQAQADRFLDDLGKTMGLAGGSGEAEEQSGHS